MKIRKLSQNYETHQKNMQWLKKDRQPPTQPIRSIQLTNCQALIQYNQSLNRYEIKINDISLSESDIIKLSQQIEFLKTLNLSELG